MKSLHAVAALGLVAVGAQSPDIRAEPAPSEAVSTYIDTYYSYNFNNPDPTPPPANAPADPNYASYRGEPLGGTRLRNFDVHHNQFTLALAELSYHKTAGDVAVKADFDFGDIADMTNATGRGVDEVGKHVGQAIISYSPAAWKALTINLGKMPTHMGYEVTKAKDDWQYSRSFLYAYAIPYWHTGVNVALNAIPDVLSAGFYVYNGWNAAYENNRGKTIGLQLNVTPIKQLTLTYNGIGGPEQDDNEKSKKIVHELIAVLTANDHFALASDFVAGSEDDAVANSPDGPKIRATWSALQVGVKYSPSARLYFSPRLEAYWDGDGYTTGNSQTLHEATLTTGWKATDQLETRLEVRHDLSTRQVFLKAKEGSKNQTTLTWGTLLAL